MPPIIKDDREAVDAARLRTSVWRIPVTRSAFRRADFVAEVKRRNMGLDPVFGEEMTEQLAKAFALPKDIIENARDVLGGR